MSHIFIEINYFLFSYFIEVKIGRFVLLLLNLVSMKKSCACCINFRLNFKSLLWFSEVVVLASIYSHVCNWDSILLYLCCIFYIHNNNTLFLYFVATLLNDNVLNNKTLFNFLYFILKYLVKNMEFHSVLYNHECLLKYYRNIEVYNV